MVSLICVNKITYCQIKIKLSPKMMYFMEQNFLNHIVIKASEHLKLKYLLFHI